MEHSRFAPEKIRSMVGKATEIGIQLLLFFFLTQFNYFMGATVAYNEFASFNKVPKGICVFVLVITALVYQTLIRSGTIYDRSFRDAYAENAPSGFLRELKFLFCRPAFWVKYAVFAFALLVLPARSVFCAFYDLFGGSFPVKLLLLPVLLFWHLFGGVSAMHFLGSPTNASEIAELNASEKANRRAFVKYTLFSSAVYVFAFVLLFGYFIIAMVWSVAKDPLFGRLFGYVLAILVLIPLIRRLRCLRKRAKAIKHIRKVCASEGITISEIRYPYRSLTTAYKGEDFSVTVQGKTYSCKFIGELAGYNPITVRTDGTVMFHHAWIRIGRLELFTNDKMYYYAWESEHPKILIVNPRPKRVEGSDGVHPWQMDNGDRCGEYKVYTAHAFANALERNCIDR